MKKSDFIGKKIRIVSATNKLFVGKQGVVIDETKHMLCIETTKGRKQILKKTITFCVLENEG